jgi:hypothetical protein
VRCSSNESSSVSRDGVVCLGEALFGEKFLLDSVMFVLIASVSGLYVVCKRDALSALQTVLLSNEASQRRKWRPGMTSISSLSLASRQDA